VNKTSWIRNFVLFSTLSLTVFSGAAPPPRGEPLPRKGALGVQLALLTPEQAQASGLAAGEGRRVDSVVPNLTAAKLGVQPGDILLRIGSTSLRQPQDLAVAVRNLIGGQPTKLEVLRQGKRVELTGTIQERPRQVEPGQKVIYDQVVSQGKRIRIIATHPEGQKKYPTIFMIPGIGAYSMDGPFATMPYGNILGPLAQVGYATVRIEKPGQGDSEGPLYTDLTFEEELDAYIQAVRMAKTYDFVDTSKLVIFGHSMGGVFGPIVNKNEPVSGMIAAATGGKDWTEYMIENTRRQLLLGGATAAQTEAYMKQYVPLVSLLFAEGWSLEKIKNERPGLQAFIQQNVPDGKTMSGVGIPFFQTIAKTNIAGAWESVKGPALLLYGENDFVTCREDHEFLAEAVNRSNPGKATFQLLARSDHGFNETDSQADSMSKWGKPGNKFNPNVIEVIREWLKKHFPASASAQAE